MTRRVVRRKAPGTPDKPILNAPLTQSDEVWYSMYVTGAPKVNNSDQGCLVCGRHSFTSPLPSMTHKSSKRCRECGAHHTSRIRPEAPLEAL